ncbi:hypothetical protein QTP88_028557 [Uroleucon formosanum]
MSNVQAIFKAKYNVGNMIPNPEVMTIEDEDMTNNTSKRISVVKLATTSEGKHIAVGYSNSLVNTFNLETGKPIGTFQGHKSAITALTYDTHGHMLASGSKDTEAVI